MTKQTKAQEVQARIKELQEKKAQDLLAIQLKLDEARTQLEAADREVKEATEDMNLEAYEVAKEKQRKAQTAIDMFTGRYQQIKAKEYISETESDKVVDSLLAYEGQLEEDFKKAIAVHIKQLAKLHEDYVTAVRDTEKTLSTWQLDIHANYRTRGGGTRTDPFTGERTERMEKPTPVHMLPYQGCVEAARLGDYLKKESSLVEG